MSELRLASTCFRQVVRLVVVVTVLLLVGTEYRGCQRDAVDGRLLSAADAGDTDRLVNALRRGADPNARTMNGLTPLMLAANKGHEEAVALLLRRGADINARVGRSGHFDMGDNIVGWTALMGAVESGQVAPDSALCVARQLLAAGADVQARTVHGRTALSLAQEYQEAEMSDLLRAAIKRAGRGSVSGDLNR